jgi:hypothetical protein
MLTVQDAEKSPSTVFTVIVVVPGATPVTMPVELTVAIAEFAVDQVTFLLVAVWGDTVAESTSVFPATIVVVVLFNATPETGTDEVALDHTFTVEKVDKNINDGIIEVNVKRLGLTKCYFIITLSYYGFLLVGRRRCGICFVKHQLL